MVTEGSARSPLRPNGARWDGAPAATTASPIPIRRRMPFLKTDGARQAGARAAATAFARSLRSPLSSAGLRCIPISDCTRSLATEFCWRVCNILCSSLLSEHGTRPLRKVSSLAVNWARLVGNCRHPNRSEAGSNGVRGTSSKVAAHRPIRCRRRLSRHLRVHRRTRERIRSRGTLEQADIRLL